MALAAWKNVLRRLGATRRRLHATSGRLIFKLWKLPSNERLLSRTNLKSRTGPPDARRNGRVRGACRGREGTTHPSCRSVEGISRAVWGLRCNERARTRPGSPGHGGFVLLLREFLFFYRGDFIAFKGIKSPIRWAGTPDSCL